MKQQQQLTVRLKGKGATAQRAFADALSAVQNAVLKNSSDVILRIEPLDVRIVSSQKRVTKEKFLFFFLSRDKELYQIEIDIDISVTLIRTKDVHFELVK